MRGVLRSAGLVAGVVAAVSLYGTPAQAAPAAPVAVAAGAPRAEPRVVVPNAPPTKSPAKVTELPDMSSAVQQAAEQGARVRVSASGTPFSETYANPDGSLTAEVYPGPAFRRAGADRRGAEWLPLSGAVSGTGTSADPFAVGGLALPVTLGRSAASLVSVAAPRGAVTFGAEGLQLARPVRDGQTITFPGAATDTDLQLVVSGAGVKTNLVLKSAAAPRSYRFHISDPAGALGEAAQQSDGSWLFSTDLGDGYRMSLAPAAAYVPAEVVGVGPGVDRSSASQQVVRAGDGWDVTLAVDPQWLAGKAFPVVLDPSPVFVAGGPGTPGVDCHLASGYLHTISYCGQTGRDVGMSGDVIRRTLLKFDMGTLPSGAMVSTVDLDLAQVSTENPDEPPYPIDVHPMTQAWNQGATWESTGSGAWTTPGGTHDEGVVMATTSVPVGNAHYHWALSPLRVQSWITAPTSNYGVILRSQKEGTSGSIRFGSAFVADPALRPRLTVTYTDPAALQVDRRDSYSPVLSGLVSGSGTYDQVSFTVTRPAGVGGGTFTSATQSRVAGQRAAYTIERAKGLVAGQTYTWTMKQCKAGACTTSSSQSFTVDPLIAAGDRGFFTYRDWKLSDRLTLKVNAASGNLLAQMSDLSVPGINGDTTLGRTYNSLARAPGAQSASGVAGAGWTSAVSADVRVAVRPDGSAAVYTSSGYAALFVPNAAGGFTGPAGINATLSRPDAKWRYADHGSGATWDFDGEGRLLTVKDRSKNTTTIRRDASGNVSAVDGSRGGPDPTGGQSTRRVKVNDGLASTPSLRKYTQLPNPGSPLATRTVDFGYAVEDLSTVTDAAGKVTKFEYDGSHRLTKITVGFGETAARVTTIGYESGGYRVASVRQETAAGVGPVTGFAYDDLNKKTTVTPPRINADPDTQLNLTYTWDNEHRVTKLTNGFGKNISTKTYNGNSQVATSATATNSAAGVSTVNEYESDGERMKKSTSAGSSIGEQSGWGQAGSATEFLPGTSTNAAGSASTYRYDGAGNMSSNTGGATNEAIVERNADGTVAFTTDPENINDGTTKAAPACRRSVGATNYIDNCTSYTYVNGNVTAITPPNNAGNLQARAFTYDGFGRLSTMNNGRGYLTAFTYDALDRTVSVASGKSGDTGVTYTYDSAGNQTSRVDVTGTVIYRYDKLNRLVVKDIGGTAVDCAAGPTATRLCYGWDEASHLISLGDARGTTTYHYSPIGLLDEVNEHNNRTIVMSYDEDQRRISTWYATNIAVNGTTYPSNVLTPPTSWALKTTNTLDADGRLTNIKSWRASATPVVVSDLSYSYKQPAAVPAGCTGTTLGRGAGTDAGRRTSRTDNVTALTQSYCYDGAGRLRFRVGTGSTTAQYTYDKSGNRLSDIWASTTTSYTYNAANQVTNTGWTYDDAGNQLTGGNLTAAAYNGYDQASSMTPTGGAAINLTAAGTRNTELVTQGGTTLRNGLTGVQTVSTGGYDTYFQRAPDGGLLSMVTEAGSEYYYVLDGQSSVIGLVDSTGTERARYTYDPYGAHDTATGINGTLPDNPYRYASGRAVATNASGNVLLYQYGERFYNPTTGRWTQQDNLEHLGDPTQGNRYTYVAGDPVNGVDPTGRDLFGFLSDVGAAAAGGMVFGSAVGAGLGALGFTPFTVGTGYVVGGAIGLYAGAIVGAAHHFPRKISGTGYYEEECTVC